MSYIGEGSNHLNRMNRDELMKRITLKKVNTSCHNKEVLRRATTLRISEEKANYETELIWENEETMMKGQEMFPRKKISPFKFFFHLFEPIDWVYFIIGIIGCLACGISTPLIYYLNSEVYSEVGNTSEQRESLSEEEIMKENVKDTLNSSIKKQLIYGAIALVDNFLSYFFIGLISTRCLYTFKKRYFKAIFAQEQAWFDSTNVFLFASKIQTQLEYIEFSLGDKIALTLVSICIAIGSLIFAFLGSWKLTLVILCLEPFMIFTGICLAIQNTKGNDLSREVYEYAGSIAEEILYNIKIISSFANFDFELKRFYEQTEISAKLLIKTKLLNAIFLSLLYLGQILSVFIGIIYGRTLVKNDFNTIFRRDTSGGDISLTFNCMVSFIASSVDILNEGADIILSLSASSDYFNLIERKPQMDLTNSIEKPPFENIKGNIEFENVDFYYPSDPNKNLILNGINLKIFSGKKIALIGESGSGKTTLVNLIMRLYDRSGGNIILDGIDINRYDIQYLRNLIGYVEQEPILFNRSIKDNIIFGREKYLMELNEDIDQLVQNACLEANVTEFLDKVPGGLDYIVGIKGSKLSGGQKQRIAIARAILTKPKILILDEATSALDNKTEQIVQKALDNIGKKTQQQLALLIN